LIVYSKIYPFAWWSHCRSHYHTCAPCAAWLSVGVSKRRNGS